MTKDNNSEEPKPERWQRKIVVLSVPFDTVAEDPPEEWVWNSICQTRDKDVHMLASFDDRFHAIDDDVGEGESVPTLEADDVKRRAILQRLAADGRQEASALRAWMADQHMFERHLWSLILQDYVTHVSTSTTLAFDVTDKGRNYLASADSNHTATGK